MQRSCFHVQALRALVCLLAAVTTLSAQNRKKPGDPITLEDPRFEGIYYWLHVPSAKRGELLPLVFALHGNGQDSKGHFRRMSQLSTSKEPVIVVAPQYQKGKKFGDPVHPQAQAAFEQILADVCKAHPVDESRMVLQGFSMGAIYSCRWAFAKPGEFPFRALFLNSSVMPPRGEAPRVPYLLWVGTKERKVAGRYDVLKSVREVFEILLKGGYDAWYLEMEGKGHTVAPESLELQRRYLAAMPSYAALADVRGKSPEELQPVLVDLRAGRIGKGLEKLGALGQATNDVPLAVRSAVKKLERSLPREVEKLAKELARGDLAELGFLRYEALRRVEGELAGDAKLQAKVAKLREKAEKGRAFARELEAREAWQKARELCRTDVSAGKKALQELATGKWKETEAGRRAAAAVLGLTKL